MYINKIDYKTRLSSDLLNRIIMEEQSTGEDILETVSKAAEDTITTLAGVLYNVTDEWIKPPEERNGLILSWALSISCYWLYQRIDDEDVPAKVIKNYEDVLE